MFFNELIANDFRYTHSSGRVKTKTTHLDVYRSGSRYERYVTSNVTVNVTTPDIVVFNGEIDQRRGTPADMREARLLFREVWRC